MQSLKLPGGGSMPRLGFGTFELAGDDCVLAVTHALSVGYRHIDTAAMYDNEAEVGKAIGLSNVDRESLFVTTKIWRDDLSPAGVRRSAAASLKRLGREYVDLLLIHWPNPEFDLKATIDAMEGLREEGRVRHIGVSNFNPSRFREAAEHAQIACNQVEYHPLLSQDKLLSLAGEHGAALTAYSPLAQGKVLQEPRIETIARRLDRKPAQVALRWLLQQDHVAAIPRSSDPEHIEANLRVFDFALPEDDLQAINELARGERIVNPEWAPEWGR